MTPDQALAKIKKCLALVKSQNPHEAAAAMRQAQKLMTEHNLNEQDVSLADVTESLTRAASQSSTLWDACLARSIANAFGCEFFVLNGFQLSQSGWPTKRRSNVFVGAGACASVASYAYEVLSRQCASARLDHLRRQPKNCKPITKTARGDEFALGWVYGVRDLLDKFANSDRNQALLQSYIQAKHPDMQSGKAKHRGTGNNVSQNDLRQGMQAGKNANLKNGLTGAAAQGLLV